MLVREALGRGPVNAVVPRASRTARSEAVEVRPAVQVAAADCLLRAHVGRRATRRRSESGASPPAAAIARAIPKSATTA